VSIPRIGVSVRLVELSLGCYAKAGGSLAEKRTNRGAKVVISEVFVEGKLEAPKHLARTVHDLYFETIQTAWRTDGDQELYRTDEIPLGLSQNEVVPTCVFASRRPEVICTR
jgi:hypothetical protein